jgi:hypothetical protein
MIAMKNGTKWRNENSRIGDTSRAFDPATSAHLPRRVTRLYLGETQEWVELAYLSTGAGKTLVSTTEHPSLTPEGQFAQISQVIGGDERRAA